LLISPTPLLTVSGSPEVAQLTVSLFFLPPLSSLRNLRVPVLVGQSPITFHLLPFDCPDSPSMATAPSSSHCGKFVFACGVSLRGPKTGFCPGLVLLVDYLSADLTLILLVCHRTVLSRHPRSFFSSRKFYHIKDHRTLAIDRSVSPPSALRALLSVWRPSPATCLFDFMPK